MSPPDAGWCAHYRGNTPQRDKAGEISLEENGVEPAGISGVVGDPTGAIWAGRFVRGLNPVCITIEAVLEELLLAPEEDWRRPF